MAGLRGCNEGMMERHASRPVIIFDFDGTIADSLHATLRTLYELTHTGALPVEDVSRLRGMTMIQVLRQLKVPLWRALFLKQKVYNLMRDRMDDIALVPGVDEMVAALAQTYQLYVVSSNDEANVQIFLQRFQLKSFFAKVYGRANPLRKGKVLRRVLRENGIDAKDAWYVGDQAWDIVAAHSVGMRAVAVAWGFSNLHILKSRHPESLVFSPDELVNQFTSKAVANHE